MKHYLLPLVLALALASPAFSQQRSAKKGVCWDEKTQPLTAATLQKLAPGVSFDQLQAKTGVPLLH